MAVPQQPAEALIPALAEYLATNTDVSDWLYYSDVPVESDPKGAIALINNNSINNEIIDGISSTWRFQIKLLLFSTSETELLKLSTRWYQYIRDDVMRSLWRTGHTTTIDGITLTRAFAGIQWVNGKPVNPAFNQDGGGTASIYWIYDWADEKSLSQGIGFD